MNRVITPEMKAMFPCRWKDRAGDSPVIRDHPQECATTYFIFGVNTRTVQSIYVETLCQSETVRVNR